MSVEGKDDNTGSSTDFESHFVGKVKGSDDDDLEQKCLTLCHQYLGGIWSQITVKDIEIKRLTGGMSNKTYVCKVVGKEGKEYREVPLEVVIKFYGPEWDFSMGGDPINNRLDEAFVAMFASKKGIGPRIYGLFKEGQILKYYSHRHFNLNDFKDKTLSRDLAIKMAKFHALGLPSAKKKDFVKTSLISSVRRVGENSERYVKAFEEYDCKTLLKCDMNSEVKWLLDLIPRFNSPLVFSHNDFRFANIMIDDNNEVILSDFEVSGYYYRGMDFASLFYTTDHDQLFIREFITEYLKEGQKILGKIYSEKAVNSVDHILKEMKEFSVIYSLFVANQLLHNDIWQMPIDEKTSMNISEGSMEKYMNTKKLLFQ